MDAVIRRTQRILVVSDGVQAEGIGVAVWRQMQGVKREHIPIGKGKGEVQRIEGLLGIGLVVMGGMEGIDPGLEADKDAVCREEKIEHSPQEKEGQRRQCQTGDNEPAPGKFLVQGLAYLRRVTHGLFGQTLGVVGVVAGFQQGGGVVGHVGVQLGLDVGLFPGGGPAEERADGLAVGIWGLRHVDTPF